MDDDSSFEDFSEIPLFTEDEPKTPQQKEVKRNENNSFEILTIEKIVENVSEMVVKVQNFLGVRICNEHFLEILFLFRLPLDKYEKKKKKKKNVFQNCLRSYKIIAVIHSIQMT